MKFCTHTIVKNGMPFIGLVLRQVIPFAHRCLITISTNSTDGTLEVLQNLQKEYPDKVVIDYESVQTVSMLTLERQKQVEKTTEDWILFLDDDDFWPYEALQSVLRALNDKVDALTVHPYQLLNKHEYDGNWNEKWFTKWIRKQSGLHYAKPWPRDLIFVNDRMLYWKKNPLVVKHPARYFHLSYLKDGSFRNEAWANKYKFTPPYACILPIETLLDTEHILKEKK